MLFPRMGPFHKAPSDSTCACYDKQQRICQQELPESRQKGLKAPLRDKYKRCDICCQRPDEKPQPVPDVVGLYTPKSHY